MADSRLASVMSSSIISGICQLPNTPVGPKRCRLGRRYVHLAGIHYTNGDLTRYHHKSEGSQRMETFNVYYDIINMVGYFILCGVTKLFNNKYIIYIFFNCMVLNLNSPNYIETASNCRIVCVERRARL